MRPTALLLTALALVPLLPASPVLGDDPVLVLNEVLVDPEAGEDEWVEIHNPGPAADLEGFVLTDQDGHAYAFGDLRMPAGGYVLLRVGPGQDTGFDDGTAVLHWGLAHPVLNNDGDDLVLEGDGRVLAYLRYGDGPAADPPPPGVAWEGAAPLPPRGLSLALHPNGRTGAGPDDWRVATPTPGASNDPAGGSLLLAEVLYRAPRDNEYAVLANVGSAPVDLAGWRLTDGEGTWTLPSQTLDPGGRVVVAQNATSLREDGGLEADACLRGCRGTVASRGTLALRDGGDGLLLLDPGGGVVDAFYHGEVAPGPGWDGAPAPTLPPGRVAVRQPGGGVLRDTNRSADWEWDRTFRLGQGRRPVLRVDEAGVQPFRAPEGSLAALLTLVGAAREEVLLAGFTLSQEAVAEALVRAAGRGVRVTVGVEGDLPGGVSPDEQGLRKRLAASGVRVLVMGAGEGWRRYALHHAKYVVVDGAWVLLGSENFSGNGYPRDGRGNRGWGVVVLSPPLAATLRDVAREDWNASRSDVEPLVAADALPRGPALGPTPFPEVGETARVRLLLSPDNAGGPAGLVSLVEAARRRVDLQLFYLRWTWGDRPNPFVEAVLAAARRGVAVRVLLDGESYNRDGPDDNDEAVVRLTRLAEAEGLPLQARLHRPDGVVGKLHNKGLLVDGRAVLVSSINWNAHGAYENREAALYVENGPAAAFFQETFDADWRRSGGTLPVAIHGPARLRVGEAVRYEARVPGATADLDVVWDLHGDGVVDGRGTSFIFVPRSPGTTVLVLRATDGAGARGEVRLHLEVLPPLPVLPPGVLPLLTAGSAAAAGAWWWTVRTRGEATNKREGDPEAWPTGWKSRQGRSRSTPTAPSTGGSTDRE